MKKYTFNIDLIIVVTILFALCIGANVYQSHLHDEIYKENMELQISLIITQLELRDVKIELIDVKMELRDVKMKLKNSNM